METDPCETAWASIKCALVVQADAIDDARVSRSSRGKKSVVGGKSCHRTEAKRLDEKLGSRRRVLWIKLNQVESKSHKVNTRQRGSMVAIAVNNSVSKRVG